MLEGGAQLPYLGLGSKQVTVYSSTPPFTHGFVPHGFGHP